VRVAAALIAVGAAVLATPAEAKRVKPPTLTRDTTITTSSSGWIDVALRDDAVLSPKVDANPDVSVTGTGRLVAFWITSLGTSFSETDSLEVYRLPSWQGGATSVYGTYDGKQTCSPLLPVDDQGLLDSCTKAAERIVLHEGFYRISVLADDAPISLHLDLVGLADGVTEIHPTHLLASAERDLPLLESAADRMVSFGGTAHAPGAEPKYLLTDLKTSGDTGVFESGQCVRQDATPAPPGAYLPPCPGGSGDAWFNAKVGGTGTGFFYYTPVVAYAPSLGDPYDIGMGGSYSDAGGLTLKHALGVWLQPTPS
jgi:hypothetical protein